MVIFFLTARFTNMTYGSAAGGGEVELNSVQVVARGTAGGYDNPGYAPAQAGWAGKSAKQDKSIDSEEGLADNDSAFQEYSIAVRLM